MSSNPVCVALDTKDLDRAVELARTLRTHVGWIKVGMEIFYAHGRTGYERIAGQGIPVFLDLKLHDIPNTVAQGLRALMTMAPRPGLINVHCGAGRATLKAAADAIGETGGGATKLIGLTVLTSLDGDDLAAIGYDPALSSAELVTHQAKMAAAAGLDGVVCSPLDIAGVKQACGKDFLTVVPGIRPASAGADDQKRIATPHEALAAGAEVLVIGRPITAAPDPAAAAAAIIGSLELAA
jgi:orotidine-5'-phosphate decarboxylase